jgi:hypothetical protein
MDPVKKRLNPEDIPTIFNWQNQKHQDEVFKEN